MPVGYAYPAIVVLIAFATVVPAFVVTRIWLSSSSTGYGYLVGLGCGVLTLVAEANLINFVSWDDVFFVVLLPIAGVTAAWIWPTQSAQKHRYTRMTGVAALLVISAALVYREVSLQNAYVDIPFEVKTKGSVAEVQFRIAEGRPYTFFLNLYFKEGDEQDRSRVRRLAGTGNYGPDRQRRDTGLSIPVHLVVKRMENNDAKSVIDGVFKDHQLHGHGAAFYKTITSAQLEPGRYRVRVEALENIPELEGVSVHFAVYVPHH